MDYLIKKTAVENITLTGGEPTISECFTELVLHAKLKGKRVTIITNGNGPPVVYKELTKMQVDMMEFSVHASVPVPLTFNLEGDLRLCNHSPVVAGNIFKQSFSDIFANPYIAE